MKYINKLLLCFMMGNYVMGQGVADDLVAKAQQIPPQSLCGSERSWSCGPNSLERFLVLSGFERSCELVDLKNTLKKCPRSCGQPTTVKGYSACAGFLAVSLYAAVYGWEGLSDVACAVVSGACAVAPFAIEYYNRTKGVGKVGPTPRWLAGFGNELLASMKSEETMKVGQFQTEKEAIKHIKQQLDEGKPVMVLVNFAPLMWHYINIVSYENDNFKYLDTCGSIDNYSQEDLVNRMDFTKNSTTAAIKDVLKHVGWYLGVDIERFNTIHWAN